MASPSNPLASQIMSALQQRSMSGAAQPGGAPGMQSNPMDAGNQYAQQVAELKGADPGGLLKQLKAIKEILAVMGVTNLNRLPNVSGQVFNIIPKFDKIIKAVQEASNVNSAVRNPINMSIAQPSPQENQGGSMMAGGF